MTMEYLQPVPLETPLRVDGREVSVHGRQHINMAEIPERERQGFGAQAGNVHRDGSREDAWEVRGEIELSRSSHILPTRL